MLTEAEFAALPVGTRVRVTWLYAAYSGDYVIGRDSTGNCFASDTPSIVGYYANATSIEVLPPPPDPERERLAARVAELETTVLANADAWAARTLEIAGLEERIVERQKMVDHWVRQLNQALTERDERQQRVVKFERLVEALPTCSVFTTHGVATCQGVGRNRGMVYCDGCAKTRAVTSDLPYAAEVREALGVVKR